MRNLIFATLFLLLIAGSLFTTGCQILGQNFGNSELSSSQLNQMAAPIVGNAKSVSFRIVLPGQDPQQADGNISNIRAATTTLPTATFKLLLINIGDTTNPTTELRKIVPVDESGTAQVTFEQVPAKTVIGDVLITNGNIGGYKEFHGAVDLFANATGVVDVSPKNSAQQADIIARTILQVLTSPTQFTSIGWGLASKLQQSLNGLDLSSASIIDQLIQKWLTDMASMPIASVSATTVAVEVPAAISLTGTKLVSVLDETAIVGQSGSLSIPESDTLPLLVLTDAEENPIMLAFGGSLATQNPSIRGRVLGSLNTPNMNAQTTAIALLAVCPLLTEVSAETKAEILAECLASSEFPQLVSIISNLLASGQTNLLVAGAHEEVYDQALKVIGPRILARPAASLRPNIRAGIVADAPTLTENGNKTITLSNNSYIYYQAVGEPEVFLSGPTQTYTLPILLLPGRSSFVAWTAWPPSISISTPVDVSCYVKSIESNLTVAKCHPMNLVKAVAILLDLFEAKQLAKALNVDKNDIANVSLFMKALSAFADVGPKVAAAPTALEAFKLFCTEIANIGMTKLVGALKEIVATKLQASIALDFKAAFLNVATKLAGGWALAIFKSADFVNSGLPFFVDWIGAASGYSKTINEGIIPGPITIDVSAGNALTKISWEAVEGMDSYNIYFSTTADVTRTNGTKLTGKTSPYTHLNLTNGTTYYYVVTAVGSIGESDVSIEKSATPSESSTAPGSSQVDLGDGLMMQLVTVSAGNFKMGQEDSLTSEMPVRTVSISKSFRMGKYEVTQAQYEKIMGTNPSYFVPNSGSAYADTSNHPVDQVSWFDAVRFCNALSKKLGLTPCYTNQDGSTTIGTWDTISCSWTANGFRLPTEAEWEYACRAGTDTKFSWGDEDDEASVKPYAWYQKNANPSYWTTPHADEYGSQPVGTREANPWGLHDMHGNLTEWCWDWLDTLYYLENENTDPVGPLLTPIENVNRVVRGGNFVATTATLRSARRGSISPATVGYFTTFRVVSY